jgi:methylmalonyl-CoA mutase, C-terminal domain
MQRTYRVVVAKPGVDDQDREATIIARTLRDGGFEVVYTGTGQTPEQIAHVVVQEDADALGLSFVSGSTLAPVSRVVDLLKEQDRDDVLVLVGGALSEDEVFSMSSAGVERVFGSEASFDAMSAWLEATLDERELQLG